MADATATEVMRFFDFTEDGKQNVAKFRKEWAELSDEDKAAIKTGIGNGTLSY